MQRWNQPIGLLGGLNTHAYAPNPTGWVDPLGLAPKRSKTTNQKNAPSTNSDSSCSLCNKNPCDDPLKVLWSNHGNKHVASGKLDWDKVVASTKTGDAKYKPNTNIEALERSVWANGTPVSTGSKNSTWKVMKLPNIIGANSGKETSYIRVECSQGVIHGHPISEESYRKYLKR